MLMWVEFSLNLGLMFRQLGKKENPADWFDRVFGEVPELS